MKKVYLISIGVFLSIVVIGFFLLKNKPEVQTPTSKGMPIIGEEVAEKKVFSNITEIEVSAFEMGYKLSTTSVKRGEKVQIRLTNTGSKPHDFIVEELNIKTKVINPGSSDMIEFTVPSAGDLTYFCSVGNHRKLGMEGKFTIQD